MSKPTTRARRTAKPVRVSPLISRYVPGLQPGAAPVGLAPRQVLLRKTMFGITLTRYQDGCELVYADGRKLSAKGPWGLLGKIFRGAAK